MRKDIAADYRRRGAATLRASVAAMLTPGRRRILIGIAFSSALLSAGGALALASVEDAATAAVLAYVTVALGLVIAQVSISVWFRRDRRTLPSLSFVEEGELGRVTAEDGSVIVPQERRDSVIRATDSALSRLTPQTVLNFGLGGIALLLAALAATLSDNPPEGLIIPAIVCLQGINQFYYARQNLTFIGHNATARSRALELPSIPSGD